MKVLSPKAATSLESLRNQFVKKMSCNKFSDTVGKITVESIPLTEEDYTNFNRNGFQSKVSTATKFVLKEIEKNTIRSTSSVEEFIGKEKTDKIPANIAQSIASTVTKHASLESYRRLDKAELGMRGSQFEFNSPSWYEEAQAYFSDISFESYEDEKSLDDELELMVGMETTDLIESTKKEVGEHIEATKKNSEMVAATLEELHAIKKDQQEEVDETTDVEGGEEETSPEEGQESVKDLFPVSPRVFKGMETLSPKELGNRIFNLPPNEMKLIDARMTSLENAIMKMDHNEEFVEKLDEFKTSLESSRECYSKLVVATGEVGFTNKSFLNEKPETIRSFESLYDNFFVSDEKVVEVAEDYIANFSVENLGRDIIEDQTNRITLYRYLDIKGVENVDTGSVNETLTSLENFVLETITDGNLSVAEHKVLSGMEGLYHNVESPRKFLKRKAMLSAKHSFKTPLNDTQIIQKISNNLRTKGILTDERDVIKVSNIVKGIDAIDNKSSRYEKFIKNYGKKIMMKGTESIDDEMDVAEMEARLDDTTMSVFNKIGLMDNHSIDNLVTKMFIN